MKGVELGSGILIATLVCMPFVYLGIMIVFVWGWDSCWDVYIVSNVSLMFLAHFFSSWKDKLNPTRKIGFENWNCNEVEIGFVFGGYCLSCLSLLLLLAAFMFCLFS